MARFERVRFAPGFTHGGRGHVAVADGAGGGGRRAGLVILVNAQRHDPSGMFFHQRFHARGRIRRNRVEQAGAFEETGRGLVLEAVFQVAMVVLIRFRVNDDGVGDPCLADELDVRFERLGRRLVRGLRRVREALRIEEVHVGIDEQTRGPGGAQRGACQQPEVMAARDHPLTLSLPCATGGNRPEVCPCPGPRTATDRRRWKRASRSRRGCAGRDSSAGRRRR